MVKVMLFDFGGVLGNNDNEWKTTFIEISDVTGLTSKELDELFFTRWPELKVGTKDVSYVWELISANSKKSVDPIKLEEIYENNICVDKVVIEIAIKLKNSDYQMAILANAAKRWMDVKIEKFNLNKIFEKIYSSADLGMKKPDLNVYEHVIKDLNVAPEEILFIDNLERNTLVAEKLGIKCIVFKNAEQLKEDLEKFGIKV
jgi:HAD superfamily hydrolase (TIGR01509 family)